jgi:hypothetical protein
MEYTKEVLDEIRELVTDYADRQFECANWSEEDCYVDDLEAVIDGGNDFILEDCIGELEVQGYEVDRDNEELMEVINGELAKQAQYYLDTYNPENFED